MNKLHTYLSISHTVMLVILYNGKVWWQKSLANRFIKSGKKVCAYVVII